MDSNLKWEVYIVQCSDGTLYTGVSNNVEARVKTHNSGKGAKYCLSRLPVNLVYRLECRSKVAAMVLEYAVKKLSRTSKLKLCASVR